MIRLSIVVVALAVATGTAAAQDPPAPQPDVDSSMPGADALFARLEAASPVLADIAEGALRRARRKVSIGPTVGVFGGYGEAADAALTFGLGVEVFKIPVLPTLANLKALIRERAKAKLVEAIRASFQGQPPDQARLDELAAEVWREALEEVLGMNNIRPKVMERPQFTFALEANRYLDAATWATRLRLGVGVWKATLGAALGAAFTDPKTNLYVGPEIVLHFLTSKAGRASVLDVFVRADFEVRSRGEPQSTDIYSLGARYLLDVL